MRRLDPLSRLLTHLFQHRKTTNQKLSDYIKKAGGNVSVSTVSRWTRGESKPNSDEIKLIAEATDTPVQTLEFLALISGDTRQLIDWSNYYPLLACESSKKILLAGSTAVLIAIQQLCDSRKDLNNKSLTMLLTDQIATRHSETHDLELRVDDAIWVTNTASLLLLAKRNPDLRAKLWVRRSNKLGAEILANDLVALTSSGAEPKESARYDVSFRGDQTWQSVVDPLEKQLKAESDTDEYELIWNSEWRADDERQAKLSVRTAAINERVVAK
jgi:transcriptional regulator with XRE-family HTH domain